MFIISVLIWIQFYMIIELSVKREGAILKNILRKFLEINFSLHSRGGNIFT